MSEITFITACQACGAKNRVRLIAGRRVRIRCGQCGEPMAVDTRGMLLKVVWQRAARFFGHTLPLWLLALVNAAGKLFGALLTPLNKLLGLVPWRLRKRLAWASLTVLALYSFMADGTIKFSSLLLLAVLMALVTLVVVFAARGPRAVREIFRALGGKLMRSCPNCGHRYFPLVKNCPNCGR